MSAPESTPENLSSRRVLWLEGAPPQVKAWLGAHRSMPETHRTYESAMVIWLEWCHGGGFDPIRPDRRVAEAFDAHLAEAPSERTGRVRTERTRAKLLSAVSSLCHRLLYDDIIDRNPFAVVDRPKAGANTTQALTQNEARRVLAAAHEMDDRTYNIVRLFVESGARAMTVTGIRIERLRHSDERMEAIVPTKGGQQEIIQLPESAALAVEKLRGERTEGPLLVSAFGKPLGYDGLAGTLARVGMKAGIRLTPHMFRATFATIAAEKDVPVEDIRAQLNHKHLETTMGYIRRMETTKRARRAVDAVSAAIGAGA